MLDIERLVNAAKREPRRLATISGMSFEYYASAETQDFLADTFVPIGIAGVRLEVSPPSSTEILKLAEVSLSASELADLWGCCADRPFRWVSITADTWSKSWDLDGCVVTQFGGSEIKTACIQAGSWLLVAGADDLERKRNLPRIMRYIAHLALEDDGYVAFHASAASIDGRGLVILGDSGSGKSTLSLALAKYCKRGAWIANDRTYLRLRPSGKVIDVLGFPLPVALNYGSLIALDMTKQYGDWNLHSPRPSDSSDWRSYDGESKLKISPGEVQSVLGIQIEVGADFHALILPEIAQGGNAAVRKCVPLSETHVQRIRKNCLTLNETLYGDDWLNLRRTTEQQRHSTAYTLIHTLLSRPSLEARCSEYSHTAQVANLIFEKIAQ